MKSTLAAVCPLIAIILASCASQKADVYDTSDPYGAPDAGYADASQSTAVNPVYDTPPAYEESTASAVPAHTEPAAHDAPTPSRPSSSAPKSHIVGKGDTLWGLSKKYSVPVDSIKQANGMTKDVLLLGRTVVIPAR